MKNSQQMGSCCSVPWDNYSPELRQIIIENNDKRMGSRIVRFKLTDLQEYYKNIQRPNSLNHVTPFYNFDWTVKNFNEIFIPGDKITRCPIPWWYRSDCDVSFFLNIDVGEFKDAKLGFTTEQVVALGLEKLQKEIIDKND